MLVFVADNLAYFPYHTLDEPLHLISQIEVYVSVSGSNVLQGFKEVRCIFNKMCFRYCTNKTFSYHDF